MDKRSYLAVLLLAAAVMIMAGCGGTPVKDTQQVSQSEEAKPDMPEEAKPDMPEEAPQEEEISEAETAKLRAKLEIQQSSYSQQREAAQQYQDMLKAIANLSVKELIQSEMLQCYEENALLAVEMKTLVMGSIGVEVPDGFGSDSAVDAAIEEYKDFVAGSVADAILSDIASDSVREILQNGISGSLDAYKSSGNLSDALNSAVDSAVNGVAAAIQKLPEKYALSILDETTGGLASAAEELLTGGSLEGLADGKAGGLIGEISGVLNYDTTPTALLQEMSASAKDSAGEIAAFLEKDKVSSKDMGEMMYRYAQFGNTLDALGASGGSVDFDWKQCYEKMETVYQQYVRNEIMIAMLDQKDGMENLGDVPKEVTETARIELPEITEDGTEPAGTLTEQAEQIETKIAEYEAAFEIFQNIWDVGDELLNPLGGYQQQISQISADCRAIRDYSVQNFEVQYDMAGSDWVQGNNQLNYAVGKIAKYIPGGLFFSLAASGMIDSSDKYYQNMVDTNEAISDACLQCVTDARAAVEELESRLYLLESLADEDCDMQTKYQNQCILQYLYGDGAISLEECRNAVCEQMYLLGIQMHFAYRLYSAILTNSSQAQVYEQQYQEIMDIIDPSDSGIFEESVSPERMAEYLIPIMDAGRRAIQSLRQVPAMDGRRTGFFRLYPRQTGGNGCQVYFCFLKQSLVSLTGYMNIYYVEGEPFYANEKYLYEGVVLNPDEGTDAAVLVEEAKWMSGLPTSTSMQNEFYDHGKNYLAALGWNE